MKKVAKLKNSQDLKESILKTVDLIGGFNSFINKGDKVLLKPNFNTADPFPASSDPAFVKAIIELVYEHGAETVMVGESSTMMLKTRKVMEKLGIFDWEKMDPAPKIHVFEEGKWVKKEIPNNKYLKKVSVPKLLDEIDKLILLPCLKTHAYAVFTGSLKISVGFMKPSERPRLHLKNLQEKIADLNKIIHPDLIIMDARKCFINKGPSQGDVAEPGLIMASVDRAAIDIEGVKVIQQFEGNSLKGVDPKELSQIKRFCSTENPDNLNLC